MGQMMGRLAAQERPAHERQAARGARRARQLGRPRPPRGLPRGAWRPGKTSRSSRWSATGTTAPRRRSTADAIAVHKKFDGMFSQGGSTGTVRALMDAGHPFIPVSGEAENGFRKLCAEHAADGLECSSAGQTPGLVAIAIKAAIAALQGEVIPQYDLGADPLTSRIRTSRTARTTIRT